jgi:DNA mismatch repair protein MutS2
VPVSRVTGVLGPETKAPQREQVIQIERAESPEGVSSECDLRGLRVDEALDRADSHLQRMLLTGILEISFIHGHGTGALRGAIRAWLRDLPEVSSFKPAENNRGGNGVTVAQLDR